MKIGIAADHGGFELKKTISSFLAAHHYEVKDFGAHILDKNDDFPDFVVPLAQAIATREVARGIAVCGSGVGASVVANKIAGVRAALIHENFSAHQGVEDDDMNLLCLGGRVTGEEAAKEFILAFLQAKFIGAERHLRRLDKIKKVENK